MLGDDERALLLTRMREVIERWGWKSYVCAPILEPSDRCFPDPYTPDLVGLRTVARRLMRYAGLEGLAVHARGAERASEDPLAQTSVVLTHADEHRLELTVSALGAADDVPLVLAHEIARAYVLLRSGPNRGEHPYRTAVLYDDKGEPDEALEEEVSLAACLLGFGLLVALGSHRYKAHGEMAGYVAISRWVHTCLGALTPDEAAFLLAAQGVARGIAPTKIAAWRALLSANVQKDFGRYVASFGKDRDGLLAALGVPEPSSWPAVDEALPEPLEDDAWAPEPTDEAPPEHPAFRVPEHRGWSLVILGGAITLVALIGVPLALDPALVWAVLIGGPALCLGLFFTGKQLRRADTCTVCEVALPDEVEVCPGCGGKILGTLRDRESHMAALERVNVATTYQGAIAEAQDDADPRYAKRGVKCPTCGWIPDGDPHWSCELCQGEPFNTFEHGGECPHCRELIDETHCPRCEHLAPYDWWWPEEEPA